MTQPPPNVPQAPGAPAAADVPLPADVQTVFLDAGNTLISMDYPRIAAALQQLGVHCDATAVHRAEAASRPAVSRALERLGSTEHEDTFRFYVDTALGFLGVEDESVKAAVFDAIRPRASTLELWCRVLPGVPQALQKLRAQGLQLAVVSNSDGSIEQGLEQLGLRELVDVVFDSRVVGAEKPDPAIFETALAATGADPARTIHVGDIYAVDVVGARLAALCPVLLDPFGDWQGVDCATFSDVAALQRALAPEQP
ncbi:MAG: HAD-IA family hydrolase [Planctomycetota bacterium]